MTANPVGPTVLQTPASAGVVRILHVITDLDVGGAETTLYRVVTRMDRKIFENRVVSMVLAGPIGDQLRHARITVADLGLRRGGINPIALLRLARYIRKWRPHILQTWMYHADFLGAAVRWVHPGSRLVWNIRHTDLAWRRNKYATMAVAGACAALSHVAPDRIVCCSPAARDAHVGKGYDAGKIVCISNGFDLDEFRPLPDARESVGRELGIPSGAPIMLSVARFHPDKNHRGLFAAMAKVNAAWPECFFVLCGDDVTSENLELASLIDAARCRANIRLLGRRSDISRLLSAATVFVSASSSEAFPNAIGEAMACGRCCVATDVGSTASIIGDTGVVVPTDRPEALAEGVLHLLSRDECTRSRMGLGARQRISQLFNLPDAVARYEQMYSELIGARI